ncbi:glycoside hydrolase family 16 protein [Sistotremastrum niveocremeum HHB9708]|uniref:Glycoside hydrolase family 16 protein n=1 Tax=Sistotremastrum niveocremeum HHB9708 TaxID=1314777 RepID=A0A164X7U6_9AGAM|nr:glycoside hydrolase family 16 protein [Sistotremastrum niveocremeum HHB9708]
MPPKPIYPFAANNPASQGSSKNPYLKAGAGAGQRPAQQPSFRQVYGGTGSPAQSTTSLLPPSTIGSKGSVQAALSGPSGSRNTIHNTETPYMKSKSAVSLTSISDKYDLSPDPSLWGADLNPNHSEPDDYLHNPDPKRDRKNDKGGTILTSRGIANLGCLVILGAALITLFAGYPLITYFKKHPLSTLGAFNLGGINATGQVPMMTGSYALIDPDTPSDALSIPSFNDPSTKWTLVFSDEFNVDNRSFYPGDDPYWEAVDLHYWQTNNLEWYDPGAITTGGGYLQITLSEKQTHNLSYQGGMMSTWNKFCFTGGMVLASVQLPGFNNILGLWPAIWAMGNLGRAGYGASLEGMWPYTYDSCDVGTMPNQTLNGGPPAALNTGGKDAAYALSYLPGQRLSRCTCPGESHPGPVHSEDGTFVGRSAPEIDMFEAQIDGGTLIPGVSQSAQWGPFNAGYEWFNTSANLKIYNTTTTNLNGYMGGAFQQATSSITFTNPECYEFEAGCFETYGFEYKPGFDDAYITWVSSGVPVWTIEAAGMAADARVGIAARPVPQEPMYLLANLGMSRNFGNVDLEHLRFPTSMLVDWIRVYQPPDAINIGCDPDDFPTQAYINQYLEAYTNQNLTTWVNDYKQTFPKNSLVDSCT